MEVIERMPSKAKSLDVIWRPHPALSSANKESFACLLSPGSTVRDILISAGIDTKQPIIIWLDDRLLEVSEWNTICPKPGQIINVQATVMGGGGGGGGSNPVQVVALIAVVVLAAYFGPAVGAFAGFTGATAAAVGTAVLSITGAMLVNAVFAASNPSTSLNNASGVYGAASPTYSLSGGSNRMRPYESMPVVMGAHQFFPDLAAKPFLEYQGEDQYLYQIFHLGLSSCLLADWRIGTNPITNYQEYSWQYPDAAGRITNFPNNVDSIPGADLTAANGWVTLTSSAKTYRLGIDIEGVLYYANNNGGLDSTSVQLEIQYKPSGSSTWLAPDSVITQGSGFVAGHFEQYQEWVESGEEGYYTATTTDDNGNPYTYETYGWHDTSHYETKSRYVAGSGNVILISGATQTARRATLFINVPSGTYDVRIRRNTADSTDARLQNKTSWSTLRSYQVDSTNYNGQNRRGLTIRASEQLNGTIQQLSVTASANANYWNGSSWVSGPTSNPAHWFMDFAIGRRDGNGNLMYGVGMPEAQIDLAGLNAWAAFCAAENLSFNAVLDGSQTAADILTAIARCGFGSPSWDSGKIGVIWDARNASPVAAFGMSNIIRGSFQVSYITEQLAEEVIVQYINPDNSWNQDQVRVLVPGITTPRRSSTIDLLGCTNTAMAGKFANYFAAQQYYRKRRIQWDCDFEGFVCQRGDVVLLSHDLTQWGYSGRIVSTSGSTLVLDRAIPRSGALEYLMLKRPDGTMTTYQVLAGSADSDTITLTTHPTFQDGVDLIDHIWFFSPLPTPGKKVKILSVQPTSESRLTVIATDEDPQFYAAWDGTWQSATPSTLLKSNLPVIKNLKITERLAIVGAGQIVTRVTISWAQNIGQVERVELRCRINNGTWQAKTTYNSNSIDYDFDGYGLVEVTALPINGIFVGQQVSASAQVYGKTLPPENVQGFTVDLKANAFTLNWQKVGDIDVAGYRIRWINGDSRDWGSATPIHDGLLLSSPYISAVRPTGFGTLMIKAVDTSGNESVNSSAIVINLGDALVANVIAEVDIGALGFPGGLSHGSVVDGVVVADEEGIYWNANDSVNMWHSNLQNMWPAQTFAQMVYEATFQSPLGSAGSQLTLPALINGDNWKIEYRKITPPMWTSDDNLMWSADGNPMWSFSGPIMWTTDANLMWTDDQKSMWSIPDYLPWPGSVITTEDQYQVKITIGRGSTQGMISSLVASFDVPDKSEVLSEINISASGSRLPIVKDYFSIKTVNLTLIADTSNTFIAKVIDKDPVLGPLVQCFDVTNTPIIGKVDATIQGY
ncbi:host specificity factor TipJ family phage tail protein [Polynucleobacter sp. AP-Nino-20-G2]|uniref:host specificity factor TipJ family phage tail protein n=1 Tax=Polynucleobacter sp. AP-Nino-20-G2 TaxID=2576917 RepID=UPI001BFED28C|nr:host specificity factor TipJ family phage tail protein [Polynucleobacter sp. AP-Nino-20-G2]QWE17320.1 hypothetical protein FD960_03650 [Polynucleobacter sp. AP-Nino-20-G2]